MSGSEHLSPSCFADLLRAAHDFLDAPDRDTLVNQIKSHTANMLEVVDAKLTLLDESRDEVFDDLALHLGIEVDQQPLSPQEELLQDMSDIQGAICSYEGGPAAEDLRQLFPGRLILAAPIRGKGRFMGLLAAVDLPSERRFSAGEKALITELAAFAGQALRAEEIIIDRESRDGLTGLFDQSYLRREMIIAVDRAEREQRPLSLLLFDVDHFKRVNDTAGHPTGDAVLRQVAAFTAEQSREQDLAVRYGGEEFAILMPGASVQAAWHLAERLRQSIAAVPAGNWDPWPETITISCGVAQLTPEMMAEAQQQSADQGASASQLAAQALITQADQALYHSKQHGRNQTTRADQMP